jgi:catechol 2,3-dioxygenase
VVFQGTDGHGGDRAARSIRVLTGLGEWYHHSIKITEAPQAGLGHVSWRAEGPEAVEQVKQEVDNLGLGKGWIDGDRGHGPAYCFVDPDGHATEVFWEVDYWQAPEALRTLHSSRPQKYHGRGAAVRRLDHINLMARDVAACRKFHVDTLGFKYNESLRQDGTEQEMGSWMAVTSLAHDIAYGYDPIPGASGRLHHVALWLESREEILRTADILRDADIFMEAGPARHAITDSTYLYCYEPGGNRIEIYSGGYLQFAPDVRTVVWHTSEYYAARWWGAPLPESFFLYGTPAIGATDTRTTDRDDPLFSTAMRTSDKA